MQPVVVGQPGQPQVEQRPVGGRVHPVGHLLPGVEQRALPVLRRGGAHVGTSDLEPGHAPEHLLAPVGADDRAQHVVPLHQPAPGPGQHIGVEAAALQLEVGVRGHVPQHEVRAPADPVRVLDLGQRERLEPLLPGGGHGTADLHEAPSSWWSQTSCAVRTVREGGGERICRSRPNRIGSRSSRSSRSNRIGSRPNRIESGWGESNRVGPDRLSRLRSPQGIDDLSFTYARRILPRARLGARQAPGGAGPTEIGEFPPYAQNSLYSGSGQVNPG